MKHADIDAFFATLKAANPQPNTELEYTSVFELLAAVLLSAQATDVAGGLHQDHRPVPQQGQAPDADLSHPGGAARR
jgi:endonuclease-3